VLKNIFKFVLCKENIDGTIIEKRIKDTVNKGKNYLYKPRSAGSGFHKYAKLLSPDQTKKMMEKLEFYTHFFGYAKDSRPETKSIEEVSDTDGNKYPKFDFYDFEGRASLASQNAHMDFLEVNQKMLKMRIEQHKTGKFSCVTINNSKEGFDFVQSKQIIRYMNMFKHIDLRGDK
jgi:hypothetical protein